MHWFSIFSTSQKLSDSSRSTRKAKILHRLPSQNAFTPTRYICTFHGTLSVSFDRPQVFIFSFTGVPCNLKRLTFSISFSYTDISHNNSSVLAAKLSCSVSVFNNKTFVYFRVDSCGGGHSATSASVFMSFFVASLANKRRSFSSDYTATIIFCNFWKEHSPSPSWRLAGLLVFRRLDGYCCLPSASAAQLRSKRLAGDFSRASESFTINTRAQRFASV